MRRERLNVHDTDIFPSFLCCCFDVDESQNNISPFSKLLAEVDQRSLAAECL